MRFIPLKLKRLIKEGFNDLWYFGPKVMWSKIYWILSDESENSIIFRNRILLRWLKKRYKWLLEKYIGRDECDTLSDVTECPLWIFWWQGEEYMPEIIRLCHQSKVRIAKGQKVILLTQKNIQEYVEFPDYVWDQFARKQLRIQHLADMIRVQLIQRYGGIWLDASIYCLHELPKDIFTYNVFSLRLKEDKRFVSEGRWTTFVIGGRKGNVLCSFLNDFFVEYCKTGKPFIDYFMFDCAIALAYNNLPQVKREMDKLPLSKDCYWLDKMLTEDNGIPEQIEQQATLQKIGWQKWVDKLPVNRQLYNFLQEKERKHVQS